MAWSRAIEQQLMSISRELNFYKGMRGFNTCFPLKACSQLGIYDVIVLRNGAEIPRCLKDLRGGISDEMLLPFIWACIWNIFVMSIGQELLDYAISLLLEFWIVMS